MKRINIRGVTAAVAADACIDARSLLDDAAVAFADARDLPRRLAARRELHSAAMCFARWREALDRINAREERAR